MRVVSPALQSMEPRVDFESGRILNINKPEGWTSFDVVKKIRNTIRVKKVGHAGTLDPFATGVLLVCTGRATKQVPNLMALEKEYLAELELGKTTDSFDRTGKVLSETDTSQLTEKDIADVCGQFEGEILQTPPMYSALKVNGQRLYKLARQGKTVERQPRKVNIYELEVVSMDIPFVTLRVLCSRGTYIRALAHDIGEQLGCGANLKSLVRNRIGSYRISEALAIEDFIRRYTQFGRRC